MSDYKISGKIGDKSMKQIISLLVAAGIFCIMLTGCDGDHENEIRSPLSSNDFNGKNYKSITAEFQKAGFTNIKSRALDDLVVGWLNKDGEVEQVTIDGDTAFSTDSWYPKNAAITINYHSFPEKTTSEGTASQKTTSEGTKATSNSESSDGTGEAKNKILTKENNAELATVLATRDEFDPAIAAFAKRYAGESIEFDGNIAYMNPHGSYKTRFDMLISPGDYSPTTAAGPNFQFSNVSYYDLHFTGSNIPDSVSTGANIHIVAVIGEYNQENGIFSLKPVSTKIR